MSNFKLDFDISTHRRPTPLKPRKTVPSATSAPPFVAATASANQILVASKPSAAPAHHLNQNATRKPGETDVAEDEKEEKSAKQKRKRNASILKAVTVSKRGARSSLRYLLAFIVAAALVLFWFVPVVRVHTPTAEETVSQCQTHDNAVTCRSACAVRGNCNTPRVVAFESKVCADKIHTVLLHTSSGEARRVPAFYLRVPNTTMFELKGDRGIFRPASCKAEMRNVVVRSTPIPQKEPLEGQLWWISGTSVHTFEIVREDKIIAQLDAALVLHACYSATHCVYKMPMSCSTAKKAHVFETVSSGRKKTETFVFC